MQIQAADNEKANSQAGIPTNTAIKNHTGLSEKNTGSIPKKAITIVRENRIQRVEVFGNSSGGESLIRWWEKVVGTGVNKILDFGK